MGAYWEKEDNAQQAAYHYDAGELWGKALEQGERAANQYREVYADQESARLYKQALKAAEKLGDLAAQSRLYGALGHIYEDGVSLIRR